MNECTHIQKVWIADAYAHTHRVKKGNFPTLRERNLKWKGTKDDYNDGVSIFTSHTLNEMSGRYSLPYRPLSICCVHNMLTFTFSICSFVFFSLICISSFCERQRREMNERADLVCKCHNITTGKS